ncbi:MAG: hypothetical protein ACM3Q4_14885 [Acidobacteriota bacterium]
MDVLFHDTDRRRGRMHPLFTAAVMCAAMAVLCSDRAPAAGTPAGTLIRTRSSAIFASRTRARVDTALSASVTVTVLQKAAVNIVPARASRAAGGGGAYADFPFTVSNAGNGADRFQLSIRSAKGWTGIIYADANGDAVLGADEIAAGAVEQTSSLGADQAYAAVLRMTVPPGQYADGTQDTAMIAARSAFASSVQTQAVYTTVVQRASLNGILTADLPAPRQGSTVLFTAVFTNTGSLRAENIAVTCRIPAGFTYVAASGGTVTSTLNPIAWSLGSLDPGAGVQVTLTLQVAQNVPEGTVLSEQMSMSYAAGTSSYTGETNVAQVTVASGQRHEVRVTPMMTARSGEASDTIVYRCRIDNAGDVGEVISVSSLSSRKFSWNCYRDANNNAVFDAADPVITGSSGAAGGIIDSVAAGDSVRIFAVAVMPRVTADQTRDTLRVTASAAQGAASNTGVMVTTINVPNVLVSKTIFPAGDHPAGTELTYTIAYSNVGHASVENFAVIDNAPDNTEYIANSVKVDGLAVFDNQGSVRIARDAQDKTVITVSVGRLSSARSGSVEFKVIVK